MAILLETLVVGALQTNCYLLGCTRTRQAMVIDPGDDAERILETLRRHGLQLARMVATHAHFDHVLAARPLQEATGVRLDLHPAEQPMLALMSRATLAWLGYDPGQPPSQVGKLTPGEMLRIGDLVLEVRATPGHSPGGLTLVDHAHCRAFTGDALFAGSIGRTDLPGGDLETLLEGIRTQILPLPDDYTVLSGHGPATTIGEERYHNPFLSPVTSARFRR